MLDLGVDGGKIEAQLAKMFWLELAALEFDDHITAQLEVVKQEVDEEFVATYVQQHLPTDEGEACTEFDEEIGDVFDQGIFDFTFLRFIGQA